MSDVGTHYRRSRERLTDLLGGVGEADWRTPVPTCPGWTVHDVIGHLFGIVEDVLAGRLTGPPPPEVTAEQVARHRDDRPADTLAQWNEAAGPFEEIITAGEVLPAALDVVSHEHDIRGALHRPGARDDELILVSARWLVTGLDPGATVGFDFGDTVVTTRPDGDPDYVVRTTPFEVLRLRMGRRTRDQVAALDWSPQPPGDLIDKLFMFGPAPEPVLE